MANRGTANICLTTTILLSPIRFSITERLISYPPKMRSHLSVVSIFLASFGILLWTGEAAGFCASVFENQQGKNRPIFFALSLRQNQSITIRYFKELSLTSRQHQISVKLLE